jgi:hypothetical protein
LLALYDNLDRLRAERLLDRAQAASVPHLTERGRKSFYRHAERRTARRVVARAEAPDGRPTLFTINGKPADKDGLTRWLAMTFGAPVGPMGRPMSRGTG